MGSGLLITAPVRYRECGVGSEPWPVWGELSLMLGLAGMTMVTRADVDDAGRSCSAKGAEPERSGSTGQTARAWDHSAARRRLCNKDARRLSRARGASGMDRSECCSGSKCHG